jgi:hypothetical protein
MRSLAVTMMLFSFSLTALGADTSAPRRCP